MQTISSKLYPLLTSIVDESYTDGIDRISSARENDDGSVLIVGVDGTKQIAAKITDGSIKIRLLNPDTVSTKSAAFSSANIYEQLGMRLLELALEAEFAAPKKSNGALKKKTCKTGLSCGGSCISKTKICARALSIEQQKRFKELKKRLKGGDAEAAKGIEDLRNEQQGSKSQASKKSEAKVEKQTAKQETPMTPAPQQKIMFADLADIKSDSSEKFDDAKLDEIAKSILDAGGLYRPLLIEQDGFSYKLLPGQELAYQAALRAKKMDLKKGETVNAVIVKKDYTESSGEQVDRLKKNGSAINDGGEYVGSPFKGDGSDDRRALFVDVQNIKPSRPVNDFDATEIDALADSMLMNGGLLRPLVIGRISPDTYGIIDGDLAYHAAVAAKKKDPKRGETVNAFVISPDNVANVTKQLKQLDPSTERGARPTKQITAKEAIAAIEATEARSSEKKTVTSKIAKLDMSDPTNEAYARAAIEAFKFAKKNADGLVVDTDIGGTTSSFDRTDELMRVRDRKSLSDDDVLDAGDSLRQGLRARKGGAVMDANQRLAKDIMGRLSEPQKKIFAEQMKGRDDLVEDAELLKLLKEHQ